MNLCLFHMCGSRCSVAASVSYSLCSCHSCSLTCIIFRTMWQNSVVTHLRTGPGVTAASMSGYLPSMQEPKKSSRSMAQTNVPTKIVLLKKVNLWMKRALGNRNQMAFTQQTGVQGDKVILGRKMQSGLKPVDISFMTNVICTL